MKFTLSWLRDHLDTEASVDDITHTLSMIGLEVESVEDRAKDLAPFVVGHVTDARQHPNADRLRLCVVDVGGGESHEVVSRVSNPPLWENIEKVDKEHIVKTGFYTFMNFCSYRESLRDDIHLFKHR